MCSCLQFQGVYAFPVLLLGDNEVLMLFFLSYIYKCWLRMVVRAVSGYSRMFQVNHVHVVGVGVLHAVSGCLCAIF